MDVQTDSPERLRYCVIGGAAGVMGMHRAALHLPSVELVAISDINEALGQQRAKELNCEFYRDHCDMLAAVKPDVTVIMTPHPLHARLAIDALEAGSHVLVEKPIAIQVAEADAMLAVAQQHQRLLGVVFQHRLRPEIRAAYQVIQEGRLGRLQHIEMTAVWTRTATYYRSAGWRGSWRGEGGGVLMNQAPHHLDLLCHLVGMPERVFAWTRRLVHEIETEDTVQAALEWSNGALGSLHISTAEADQSEHLKIVGTRGQLELINGIVSFRELETDLIDFIATHPKAMAVPASHEVSLPLTSGSGNHAAVYEEFNQAILHKKSFTSAGEEGRMALELANAMIYSSQRHCEVVLPLNRHDYAALLAELQG
ncbi:Gfo/Idh/MocA family protein [Tengunoibacter tsumagoiensis]|uniref:Oxidoreductase n=1 Tax=Tengunoibacter tsumagoiensis TaxID=2014871 RepID=A0A401ZUH0_9CHLR|nr:Gfo/Idh/MocA family oxidoreductase [Tengunoibacter tsumagoiensis]GCE10559.1 oxidoreductase [Tengunoibacter tsumagoiensis]